MSPNGNARLTPKQEEFVRQYLVDFNATQAAIRAGYSERTANQTGPENLVKPGIQAALAGAIEKRKKRLELETDDVLRLLLREAAGQGPDTTSSARVRAAELLGKHLGMFIDRHELGGPNGEPFVVKLVKEY